MRWFLVIGVVLILSAFAGYAAAPGLIEWLVPKYAHEFGLDDLSVVIGRPGLDEVLVTQFKARAGTVEMTGESVRLSYSLESLRRARLDTVEVGALHVRLANNLQDYPVVPAGPRTVVSDSPVPGAGALFALAPFDQARIEALDLIAPALGFRANGSLTFAPDRLEMVLLGREPEEANGIQLQARIGMDGQILIELQRLEDPGPAFVRISSALPQQELRLLTELRLDGYLLELLGGLAGVPDGSGTLEGILEIRYPWPLTGTLELAQTRISGTADIRWRNAESTVLVQTRLEQIELTDSRFHAETTGSVVLKLGDAEIRLNPRRLEGALMPFTGQLDTAADVRLQDGQRVHGELALELKPDPTGEVNAGFDFRGSAEVFGNRLPVQLDGTGRQDAQGLKLRGQLTSNLLERWPFEIGYLNHDGQFQLTSQHRQRFSKPLLAGLWPGLQTDYDLTDGSLQLVTSITGSAAGDLAGTLSIHIENANGQYDDTAIRSLNAALELGLSAGSITLHPSPVSAELVDFGVPLRTVSATISGSPTRLHVADTRLALLGGTARTDPFDYHVEQGEAQLRLELLDLDLAAVLALEGDDISGSGRLDGELPVRFEDNQPWIEGGQIRARAPGGAIRLGPGLVGGLKQPGLDLALGALTDFRYDVLQADVDYSASGDLKLGIRLHGHNPSVEKGRAIHYNLNVSENIPVLLESLRMQDTFTDRIEKQVIR